VQPPPTVILTNPVCIPGIDAACTTAGVTPPAPPKTWYQVYLHAGGGQNSEGWWRIREVDEATALARIAMGYTDYSTNRDGLLTNGSSGYTPGAAGGGNDNNGMPDPGGGGDGGNGGGGGGSNGGGYSGGDGGGL
jgi:hypothetical protein